MPQIELEKPRELCPIGPATFRLKEVEKKNMKSFDGSGEVPRLIWKFVSNRRTPEGDYYEIQVYTGCAYGNPKARLTWLLDLLSPGMTREQAKSLNTDLFVGQDYEGSCKHGVSDKDGETKFATFLYLRPLGAPRDPFLESDGETYQCFVCDKDLTIGEMAASRKRWPDGNLFCTEDGKKKIAAEQEAKRQAEEDIFAETE